jgi:hypothetical protein
MEHHRSPILFFGVIESTFTLFLHSNVSLRNSRADFRSADREFQWFLIAFFARTSILILLILAIVFSSNVSFSFDILFFHYKISDASTLIIFNIVAFASLYVTLFGPFAVWAAIAGKFTHRSLWVFLPIWPPLFLLIHPRTSVLFIRQALRSGSLRKRRYLAFVIFRNRLGGLESRENRMTDQGLFQGGEHRHPLLA